ncbi:MAG: hypothetical protein KAS32_24755 [Candidatus Peribacteraceae bacterium]|nr:hypothetical protein [Candidatus Peribacteraceae bacterium]
MPAQAFGPEQIVVQRHTQYSIQTADGQYYKANAPLTLFHFQDGMTYSVKGNVSAKGSKYISEIVSGVQACPAASAPASTIPAPVAPQNVAVPQAQPPQALPSAPPANGVAVKAPPAPPAPVAVVAPAKKAWTPKKDENVEGKIACALGVGVIQYLASVAHDEVQLVAKYKVILPQLIAFHKEQGWG